MHLFVEDGKGDLRLLRLHLVMDLFVVVQEDGEYSYREWRIDTIFKDRKEAVLYAWKTAMTDWQGEYHIQH